MGNMKLKCFADALSRVTALELHAPKIRVACRALVTDSFKNALLLGSYLPHFACLDDEFTSQPFAT
jgi:hypothetical protein